MAYYGLSSFFFFFLGMGTSLLFFLSFFPPHFPTPPPFVFLVSGVDLLLSKAGSLWLSLLSYTHVILHPIKCL